MRAILVNSDRRGFTLAEALLSFAILAFALTGILLTYANLFFLTDLCRDLTLANNALQAQMEQLKAVKFDSLMSFNQTAFNIQGFTNTDARGLIQVENTAYPDVMLVRLVISFRSRTRIIGEDRNFNGILDSGEDTLIANNRLDSPVELVTLISR